MWEKSTPLQAVIHARTRPPSRSNFRPWSPSVSNTHPAIDSSAFRARISMFVSPLRSTRAHWLFRTLQPEFKPHDSIVTSCSIHPTRTRTQLCKRATHTRRCEDPVSHADAFSREPFAQSSRDKTWVTTEGVQDEYSGFEITRS